MGVWNSCSHHFWEHSMKSQKSQQRGQQLGLHIFGFSYLGGRDLSLKNTLHAFKGCVIENRGRFTFRNIRRYGRIMIV